MTGSPRPVPIAPAAARTGAAPGGTRLQNVDALRGFALFGILAVNIWVFADPWYATASSNPSFTSPLDQAVRFLVLLLFETKFYVLFSFLFGYSFTLQMAAAERARASFVSRMARRQAGLLGIGILHGVLLYYGEILALYALLGAILLLCRDWSPRRAVRGAVWILAGVGLLWVVLGSLQWLEGSRDAGSTAALSKLDAFQGTALDTLGYHASHWLETFGALLILQGPSAMAMFLLGYAAGRLNVFDNPDAWRPLGQRILMYGLPIGLAGAGFYAWAAAFEPGTGVETAAFGVGQVTAPLLTAAYVVALLRIFATPVGKMLERALAPMGKIALTNYLLQSVLLGVLFTGYGLGLVDRFAPAAVLVMVPVIFAAQMALSAWWMRRHRYGPAEWLMRWLTNGKRPAWRVSRAAGVERVGV